MSTQAVKELSVATHTAMDFLGYSGEMIKSRAEIVKHLYSIFTNKVQNLFPCFEIDVMVTGSVGDGIAKLGGSDNDIIQIFRSFLCLDNAQVESELCVIQTITEDSPPGYTKLKPLEMDSNIAAMSLLGFIPEYDLSRGQVFLASRCMRNFIAEGSSCFEFDDTDTELREQQGPSFHFTLHFRVPLIPNINLPCDTDCVIALPYISSTVLDSWSKRDRYWPPQSVCQDIIETEAYVVPVGASCSENQNYEWRISFTNAESKLVSHLNPLLLKIYILFKMVNKYLIKPNCDILSSYIIKNVVFWVSERIEPRTCYSPERLIDFLLQALAFLLNCLHSKYLPNYMIHDRNLLLGKGKPCDITKLKSIVSNLLETAGFFVIKIEKLRYQIVFIERCFTDAKRFSELRSKFEIMMLRKSIDTLANISLENAFQTSFLYDDMFDIYKDPAFFDFIISLMNFLNFDMISCIANPEHLCKVITDFLIS